MQPLLKRLAGASGLIAMLSLICFVMLAALDAPVPMIGAAVLAYLICGPNTSTRQS